MKVRFDGHTMSLEDEPLDIGYRTERVAVIGPDGTSSAIGGQAATAQVIFALPFIDKDVRAEIARLKESFAPDAPIVWSIIVADGKTADPAIDGVGFYRDAHGDFGDAYGLRIADVPHAGQMAKAALIVTRDGSLFYSYLAPDLALPLPELLPTKIAAAITCYTGKGCHG